MSCEKKAKLARLLAFLAGLPHGYSKEQVTPLVQALAEQIHADTRPARQENQDGLWQIPLPGGEDAFLLDSATGRGSLVVGADRSLQFHIDEKGQITSACMSENGRLVPFSMDEQKTLIAAQMAMTKAMDDNRAMKITPLHSKTNRSQMTRDLALLAPSTALPSEGKVSAFEVTATLKNPKLRGSNTRTIGASVYRVRGSSFIPLEVMDGALSKMGSRDGNASFTERANRLRESADDRTPVGLALSGFAMMLPPDPASIGERDTESNDQKRTRVARSLAEKTAEKLPDPLAYSVPVLFRGDELSWYFSDNSDLPNGYMEQLAPRESSNNADALVRGYYDPLTNELTLEGSPTHTPGATTLDEAHKTEMREATLRMAASQAPKNPITGKSPKVKYLAAGDERWEKFQKGLM